MTSKELIEILNKTRRTSNISLTAEQVEELIKDLEILEILKSKISIGIDSYDENDCCKSYEYVAIDTCDSSEEPLFNENEVEKEKIVMRYLKNEK